MDKSSITVLLFGVAAVFCLIYAIYQYVSLLLNKNKISYTNATIIDTTTVAAETMKINNSKSAYVQFWINGRAYISSKRIQVSMNTSVGDEIRIACYKDNPSAVFTPNWKTANVFIGIGMLCLIILICLIGKVY